MKLSLGKRIKSLRMERKLSREAVCDAGDVLSSKQLYRIEEDKSVPSIEKVAYLAERLNITMGELFEEKVSLPDGYLSLKLDILNTQVYENPEIIAQIFQKIEKVQQDYADQLPDDEHYCFDLIEKMLRTQKREEDTSPIQEVKNRLRPLLKNHYFDLNTLILMRYVLVRETRYYDKYKKSLFGESYMTDLQERLMTFTPTVSRENWFMCRDNLITALTLNLHRRDSENCFLLLNTLKDSMYHFQDLQKKMILLMLEWKVYLLNQEPKQAEEVYGQAKSFVTIVGDRHLLGKLSQEWEKDYSLYKNKNRH